MEPAAVSKVMQGLWDRIAPTYNTFAGDGMMAPATELIIAAVRQHRAEGTGVCHRGGRSETITTMLPWINPDLSKGPHGQRLRSHKSCSAPSIRSCCCSVSSLNVQNLRQCLDPGEHDFLS